ncbi:MAG: hypothetical protein J6M31_00670 [Bacteroidales bacterium]|nr:hypothetical protein [Bacteroidales bacterium]
MKRALVSLLSALLALSALAQNTQTDIEAEFFSLPDSVSNEFLDSLKITVAPPNDYWMVGVYGGAALNYGYFNPSRSVVWQLQYPVYGFSVVRHFNMFGMFPNMGLEFGAQQNYEGYEYKPANDTGRRPVEPGSGAYKVMMKVPEAFLLSHFHLDLGEHFKFLLKLGLYGGYRVSIHRVLEDPYDQYDQFLEKQDVFQDYDKRFTYGVQGGVGAALMFSPIELHLTVQGKWGWGTFWEPDYLSQYYYRFAYPLDLAVTFGVYYQLTPRYGHTRAQLKRLARRMAREQQEQK